MVYSEKGLGGRRHWNLVVDASFLLILVYNEAPAVTPDLLGPMGKSDFQSTCTPVLLVHLVN